MSRNIPREISERVARRWSGRYDPPVTVRALGSGEPPAGAAAVINTDGATTVNWVAGVHTMDDGDTDKLL